MQLSELLLPDKKGEEACDNLDDIEDDHEPETDAGEPVTIDRALVGVLLPGQHEHQEVDAGGEYENDCLAPVHGGVADEVNPHGDGLHKSTHQVENHHAQNAVDHLADDDALDHFPDLAC